MTLDHEISKPPGLKPYQLHQLVLGLTDGKTALFADNGDTILVRTDEVITQSGRPLREFNEAEIIGFELRACVSKKIKGRHLYYPTNDWRSRHAWLSRQGQRHGFEVLTVNVRADHAKIDSGRGRNFTVDQTDFVGVLRVTDRNLFENAIRVGIGSTAKTFGFGMLIV